MNKRTVDILFLILTILIIARNAVPEVKTTWNYIMIVLGVAILASQSYRLYNEFQKNG